MALLLEFILTLVAIIAAIKLGWLSGDDPVARSMSSRAPHLSLLRVQRATA